MLSMAQSSARKPLGPPSMLEREEGKSPIKPKKLKDMEEELNKTGESEDTRRLGAMSARQDGPNLIPR